MSPGVRSLQIRYEGAKIELRRLLDVLVIAEQEIGQLSHQTLDPRVIKLPIALDDPWNKAAVERYQNSVRKQAPYLPDNIEFIARMNGLDSRQAVLDTICEAQYMVLGLGDVYLGAPCAVPLDPRHRLVSSKYNPARTFIPEGSVGIGGAYMWIYGMDPPGGYQLLRFFDRVQFYPVSVDELVELRRQYAVGQLTLDIEKQPFVVAEYHQFLADNQDSIAAFRVKQQSAFDKEVEHWHEQGMIGGEDSSEDIALLRVVG